MIKRSITGLFIWLLTAVVLQAQDFKISRFKENIMDLTAAHASVKDKNGDACALIKFSVKDDKFDFEPNLGIIKTEKKMGEVWIYVPHHTKMITIRHQYLGVLRNYRLPVEIEQKVVYEADLEITNETYLNSLLLFGNTDNAPIVEAQKPLEPEVQKPVEPEVKPAVGEVKPAELEAKPSAEDVKPIKATLKSDRDLVFEFGAGFNALGIMGPTAHIGVNYKNHVLEVGATLGISKVKNVTIYEPESNAFWSTYNYGAMRFFARYGYNIEISSFVITPMAGAAINNIKGEELERGEGYLFEKINTISVIGSCRLSYCINKTFRVYVCPEFSVGIKKDRSFNIIKEVDSKIKAMTDGFGVSAGFLIHI